MIKTLFTEYPLPPFKKDYSDSDTKESLAADIYKRLRMIPNLSDIIILCIGTDRSTGDALGPLVGSKLTKLSPPFFKIYGTLDEPIHAVNLADTLQKIYAQYSTPSIIAVDACLGQFSSVGKISVAHGPLKPGAGVKKDLPEVGTFHINGIVNVGGFMEYFVLQNTRLSIVMKMADVIATSLYMSACQYNFYKTALDQTQLIRKNNGTLSSTITEVTTD